MRNIAVQKQHKRRKGVLGSAGLAALIINLGTEMSG
jgi:hypothetical protein